VYKREASLTILEEENANDERLNHLFYAQARWNYILGRYIVPPDQMPMLAAIQLNIAFGNFHPRKCPPGYLRQNDAKLEIGKNCHPSSKRHLFPK
jgi:hypothetical protein